MRWSLPGSSQLGEPRSCLRWCQLPYTPSRYKYPWKEKSWLLVPSTRLYAGVLFRGYISKEYMQAELFANQLRRIKLRSSVLFFIEISGGSVFVPLFFKITAKRRPFWDFLKSFLRRVKGQFFNYCRWVVYAWSSKVC